MADFETRSEIHKIDYQSESEKYKEFDPQYAFEHDFYHGDLKALLKNFALRYINLMLQIKKIKQDIRVLRQEFAMQGLDTAVVIRAIKQIQQEKKREMNEITNQQLMVDYLSSDKDFDDALTELMAKEDPPTVSFKDKF